MDLAANLREREMTAIRVQLDHGLRGSVLKSLDERGGAQELVRQQYSGRYPFELLQNANDAAVDAGIRGRVTFLLTDTALIVADNGSGFGEQQVDAICSLGRSSKGPATSVGHKGLGFKSVGEITDRPQVISRETSFQFDAERVRQDALNLFQTLPDQQKFPIYAFPYSVGLHDFAADGAEVSRLGEAGATTFIRLPLRDGVAKATVAEHLTESLLPRLLLFLRGVDHLELRGTHADFLVEVSRADDDGVERVLLEVNGSLEEWLIYRGAATPELDLLKPMGEAWTKIESVQIAVAVPLDETSEPRVDEIFPLHVYFPTEETSGLHVAVHAEWALSMDRRQLASTPEATAYNEYLLEQTAEFVARTVALDLAKRTGASAQTIQALIPALTPPTAGSGTRLRKLWCRTLSDIPFLPAAGGTWQTPANMRLLPKKLPDLFCAHLVADLDGRCTLRPDVEGLESVKTFISSLSAEGEMALGEFLARLRPPSRADIGKYYAFLISCRNAIGHPLLAELRKVPSVLTTNGAMVTPSGDTIFLPRVRGDAAIPEDIPVPIAEVPEVEGLESFLRELGVKSFEWRELIREFLIKILADPDAAPAERAGAMKGLRAYHEVRISGSEDLAPALSRVLLPARTSDGSIRGLRPGGDLYFDASWTKVDDLEIIYGPFGKLDFLDASPVGDTDSNINDFDFYRMLGVQDHPRLEEARPGERQGYLLDKGRHPHRGPIFREWMNDTDVVNAARCPQGHPASQQLKLSIRLDRHLELIESADPRRLFSLWNQLARNWGSVYEPAMEAVFHCVNGSHSGERDRRCESLFAYTLRTRPWVPVARGTIPDLVRPEDAWIDSQETPRRIKERIPRISEAMYKARGGAAMSNALSLTDAGRPKITDLLALLASVARESDALGGTNREIELAARYVQRTLNDVLTEETHPHTQPGKVRLLANMGDSTAFVAQPPYAEDPLLRETWKQHRYVLAAETGLTRLTRYLSLTKLDDAVATSATAYGEHLHDSGYQKVLRRINGVKPFVLALVRTENSRAEGTARPALKRLELIVCDQLVLHYEYSDLTIERADAVCYIAIRQEKRGRKLHNVGTAYVELDPRTGEPHWFPLGRQLAQYIGVPSLSDAITMLLTASREDRDRMMADRQILPEDIAEARLQLHLAFEDDEELHNVLDSLLPSVDSAKDPVGEIQHGVDAVVSRIEPDRGSFNGNGNGNGDGTKRASVETPSSVVPPPIDYSSIEITEAAPRTSMLTGSTPSRDDRISGNGRSSAPSIREVEENYRVGRRGEEVAFNAERRRLRQLGKNPDLAVWVSKTDELSPFDIKSIDADGQIIYIEVKSTKGSDPSEPFYISHGELIEATYHRERYFIYRVTDVNTATPAIIRASDPVRLIKEGKGRLLLAKAHMALAFDPITGSG